MNRQKKNKVPAYTLNELLIVLVIIGILVLLALPVLMPLISSAKSTEAKLQLAHIHTLEQSHFYTYSKYSDELQKIGFEHEKLVTEGGNANYMIEITESGVNGFRARATSVVDFDGDGNFNIWEIDEEKNLVETNPD